MTWPPSSEPVYDPYHQQVFQDPQTMYPQPSAQSYMPNTSYPSPEVPSPYNVYPPNPFAPHPALVYPPNSPYPYAPDPYTQYPSHFTSYPALTYPPTIAYPYPAAPASALPAPVSPSSSYPTSPAPISVTPAPASVPEASPYPSSTSPASAYPTPYPYPAYPYPRTILPPPKTPEPERENEIYSRGYKESPNYPQAQARKERIIARIVFFSVIALLLVFFLSPLLTHILPKDMNLVGALLITAGFEIVIILAFSLLLARAFPQGLRDTLGLKKPRSSYVLIGVGSAFGSLTVALIGALIVVLFGGDLTESPQVDRYVSAPMWQILIDMLIFVPLVAPILEEFIFRGILVGSAVRAFPGKTGFWIAIIMTGLVFGSLHFPGTFNAIGFYVVILISSLGMFLAWLRLKANSTLVTMTTHAIYNGLIVLIQFTAVGSLVLPRLL